MQDESAMKSIEEELKLPQPDEVTKRERDDAMAGYMMMFASQVIAPIPFANLIASIIYYAVNSKSSRFAKFHMWQSLISQIPVSILNAVSIIWGVAFFILMSVTVDNTMSPTTTGTLIALLTFVGVTIILNILYFIFSIIGAYKAYHGKFFYFILFGKLSFEKFYGEKAKKEFNNKAKETNTPPEGY